MKTIVCVFYTLLFVSCAKQQDINSITTLELKQLLTKKSIQLVDIRTPKEIEHGFIKNALFADFYDDNFYTDLIQQIDKNKTIYLYCRSGGRSGKATKVLQEKGFKVVNVLGGYNQWKKEN